MRRRLSPFKIFSRYCVDFAREDSLSGYRQSHSGLKQLAPVRQRRLCQSRQKGLSRPQNPGPADVQMDELRLSMIKGISSGSGSRWVQTREKLSVAMWATVRGHRPGSYGSRYRRCTDNVPRFIQTIGKPTQRLFLASVTALWAKKVG